MLFSQQTSYAALAWLYSLTNWSLLLINSDLYAVNVLTKEPFDAFIASSIIFITAFIWLSILFWLLSKSEKDILTVSVCNCFTTSSLILGFNSLIISCLSLSTSTPTCSILSIFFCNSVILLVNNSVKVSTWPETNLTFVICNWFWLSGVGVVGTPVNSGDANLA